MRWAYYPLLVRAVERGRLGECPAVSSWCCTALLKWKMNSGYATAAISESDGHCFFGSYKWWEFLHGDDDVHYKPCSCRLKPTSENVEALVPSKRRETIKAQGLEVGFITKTL